MDGSSLYDDDVVTWAEQQAAAVRALAARGDLSNALDWENVAEEIESVGRSEIRSVEGGLEQALVHLLKHVSAPTSYSTPSWRAEILAFQAAAARGYRPSMRTRIDWDHLWTAAKRVAAASLGVFGDRLVGGLPERMPFEPEDLVGRDFEVDRALERLADVLKRGMDAH